MEIYRGLEDFLPAAHHSLVAIGNFDGIHLGHQKILKCLQEKAEEYRLSSLVLTFFPHPGKILGKNQIKMIQTIDQRIKEIGKYDIQTVIIIPFDKHFASLTGEDFIQKIVLKKLKAKTVIVGENFHFGRDREGDIDLLRHMSSESDFQICSVPSVIIEGDTVSSSLIRSLLREGKVEKANALLGRTFEIEGKVIKGKSRGKTLGFPTANIETQNEIIPPGVFITKTRIGTQTLPSMTNVGKQPTFGQLDLNIESFILNFEKNLYGERIGIQFLKKIRDEIKFSSPNDLSQQLAGDLEATKGYFRMKS